MRRDIKISILTFLFVFTFWDGSLRSQIKIGPEVGLDYSKLSLKMHYIVDNKQVFSGFHIGILTEFKISERLFLRPTCFIATRGSKYIVGSDASQSTTGFTNFQFESLYTYIPVNFIYKVGPRTYKILLILGPEFGCGFKGKWEASGSTSSGLHFGSDTEDDLKQLDFGVNSGVGAEVGRFQYSLQVYYGLRSLTTMTSPDMEQKYRVLALSVGYLFGSSERSYRDYESKFWRGYNKKKARRK